MSDAFETALRTGLRDAARDWVPSESTAVVEERVVRRIRRRRRRRTLAVAGTVAAGLVAVLLVGQVVAAPQVVHQVASPRQTTSMPDRPAAIEPIVGADHACQPACPPSTGQQLGLSTTTATTRPVRSHRAELAPATTIAPHLVTVPSTRPPVSIGPTVTLPVTTLPSTTVPEPTTTVTTQPPPQVYTITVADRGTTVDVHAGDEVVIDLLPCPGGAWSGLAVSDPTVLVRQAPPATVPAGVAMASFEAATTGQTQVTARQRSTCAATPTVGFAVTIVVS
jgi:hypothetical protein